MYIRAKNLGAFDPIGDTQKFVSSQIDKGTSEVKKAVGLEEAKKKKKKKKAGGSDDFFIPEGGFLDGSIFGVPMPIALAGGALAGIVLWKATRKKG